jgi:hypothetical protein
MRPHCKVVSKTTRRAAQINNLRMCLSVFLHANVDFCTSQCSACAMRNRKPSIYTACVSLLTNVVSNLGTRHLSSPQCSASAMRNSKPSIDTARVSLLTNVVSNLGTRQGYAKSNSFFFTLQPCSFKFANLIIPS